MLDKSIPIISVMLEQHHPDVYPHFPIPDGYTLSTYRDGFDLAWAKLVYATGMASSVEQALEVFAHEFGSEPEKIRTNCLFLLDAQGIPVATATLWHGTHMGDERPRVHWVTVDPAHQGKGLCKAVLTAVFDLFQSQGGGDYLYLTTQTWSYKAINIYQHFGFEPYLGPRPVNWKQSNYETDNAIAWRIINEKLTAYREA